MQKNVKPLVSGPGGFKWWKKLEVENLVGLSPSGTLGVPTSLTVPSWIFCFLVSELMTELWDNYILQVIWGGILGSAKDAIFGKTVSFTFIYALNKDLINWCDTMWRKDCHGTYILGKTPFSVTTKEYSSGL